MDDSDPARFSLRPHPAGLNLIAAPAFKSLVEDTVAAGLTRIVVDLGHSRFIASSVSTAP